MLDRFGGEVKCIDTDLLVAPQSLNQIVELLMGAEPEDQRAAASHATAAKTTIARSGRLHRSTCGYEKGTEKEPGTGRTATCLGPAAAKRPRRIEKSPGKIQMEVLRERLGIECNLTTLKLKIE